MRLQDITNASKVFDCYNSIERKWIKDDFIRHEINALRELTNKTLTNYRFFVMRFLPNLPVVFLSNLQQPDYRNSAPKVLFYFLEHPF
ncbi:hypothetical protein SAMN05661012_03388 [Chitinophaga sancti]|uniref:Uncharacterized protein n=1 Tax=Chitinophaga sancti TaxID=1004 RepID=A0A1K1R589_9BACT|nr:hypothetical protein SAMN05661012_03388 [Chitinophaga sancti]